MLWIFCLKFLKQYRTIEQMCSDAHSITLKYPSIYVYVPVTEWLAIRFSNIFLNVPAWVRSPLQPE